jgi:hypothetical protein
VDGKFRKFMDEEHETFFCKGVDEKRPKRPKVVDQPSDMDELADVIATLCEGRMYLHKYISSLRTKEVRVIPLTADKPVANDNEIVL